MAKRRKLKLTKGEKLLYGCAICALCSTFLLKIFCGASIGNLNMSVEKLRYDVSSQEKKIESLSMKVNELTSFDYVNGVAKDMGLAYNNENIIVIDE